MQRFLALFIMVIPGLIAAYGIKLMRDVFFGIRQSLMPSLVIQFGSGLLLFLVGLAFIAGFIFYRDRKRNKLQPRFQKRRNM